MTVVYRWAGATPPGSPGEAQVEAWGQHGDENEHLSGEPGMRGEAKWRERAFLPRLTKSLCSNVCTDMHTPALGI